ncbi:hypothetical protein ACQEXU_13190 [Vibrio sp. TRT 21S02]
MFLVVAVGISFVAFRRKETEEEILMNVPGASAQAAFDPSKLPGA